MSSLEEMLATLKPAVTAGDVSKCPFLFPGAAAVGGASGGAGQAAAAAASACPFPFILMHDPVVGVLVCQRVIYTLKMKYFKLRSNGGGSS